MMSAEDKARLRVSTGRGYPRTSVTDQGTHLYQEICDRGITIPVTLPYIGRVRRR